MTPLCEPEWPAPLETAYARRMATFSEAVEEALARARAGQDVTATLIDLETSLASEPVRSQDHLGLARALSCALLASGRAGVEHVVRRRLVDARLEGDVLGLLFRGDDPIRSSWSDNPWAIAEKADLAQSLETLWGPTEERSPAFVGRLRRRTFGLVHVRARGHGSPVEESMLLYLCHGSPRQMRGSDRRQALDWAAQGFVSFLGFSPRLQPPDHLDFVVPEALLDLYDVHGGMAAGALGEWTLTRPDALTRFHEFLELPATASLDSDDDSVPANELVAFFDHGDDKTVLFQLTDDDDPPIRTWLEGGLTSPDDLTFSQWLDGRAPVG